MQSGDLCPYLLAPKNLPIFPRARWAKWDAPVDQLGLGEAVHGLWGITYVLWVNYLSTRSLPSATRVNNGCSDRGFADVVVRPPSDSATPGEESHTAGPPPPVDTSTMSLQEQNAYNRRVSVQWVCSPPLGPLGELVVMRTVGEQLRAAMKNFLYESGIDFDAGQVSACCARQRGAAADIEPRRSFRLLNSAEGSAQRELATTLGALHEATA